MAWHDESVAPDSIHQIDFVGSTDPALDANNQVAAHKRWLDTSTSPYTQKIRNATNDGWVTLINPTLYAPLASPTFTGTPAAPTAAAGTNTMQLATTAFVRQELLSPINAQSGTSYTLVLSDAFKLVSASNASAITITVPTNASVAYPVGTRVSILQAGAGQVTVAGDTGVTVNTGAGGTLKTAEQYAVVELLKVGTDTWVLYGDREAAP